MPRPTGVVGYLGEIRGPPTRNPFGLLALAVTEIE